MADTTVKEDNQRDSLDFWLKWIPATKDAAKVHWEDAKKAWREYENSANPASSDRETSTRTTQNGDLIRTYPIYFASCKTLEPAYYSRTPDPSIKRNFDIDDSMAKVMCLITERLCNHFLETQSFDAVMMASVQDYIHADKTTTQVTYEAEMEYQDQRMNLQMMQSNGREIVSPETAQYQDEELNNYEGEVFQDEQGYFYNKPQQVIKDQTIRLLPVCYDEIIHTPEAKMFSEIRDIGIYFCLDYDQAIKRFPDAKKPGFPWKTNKRYKKDDEEHAKNLDTPGTYIDGWECWSKITKKVYWVVPEYKSGFLDVKNDPYELDGFFPITDFIIGSKPSKHMYPTPIFIQCMATIGELHNCYNKIFRLIRAIRRRCLVDGANQELVQALNMLEDNEFYAVKNLQQILEKGGIQNLIYYIPVQELVQAISELSSLDEKFKDNFYEWFGVPDILRGTSDPIETAAAQEVKAASAHDRFKFQKKQVEQLARNSLRKMVDLALKVYTDEKIMRIAGFQFMQPDYQAQFAQALMTLRNDESRCIRIDIETDSTSLVDNAKEQAQRNAVAQMVTTGLQQCAAMAETSPQFALVSLRALMYALSAFKGGKEFENQVQQAIQELIDKQSQPVEAPPPPPDYEGQKLQLEAEKMKMTQELENQKLQLQAQATQLDYQIKMQQLQIEATKVTSEQELKAIKQQQDKVTAEYKAFMEQQKLEVEKARIALDEREKLIEESRLASETKLEATRQILENRALNNQESEVKERESSKKSGGSNLTLNINGKELKIGGKPRRTVHQIVRTPQGYITTSEHVPDEAGA